MADTTTELEVLDEIVDVLGGQSGQYETVVPVLQQIKELLAAGITDPEAIAEAVAAWLDEHPEATTTVQDGSITAIKLAQDVIGLIDDKADIDGYYSQLTAGLAENLIGRGDAVPAEYLYRTAGGTADIEDGIATIDCIKGNTLVWNQMVNGTTRTATSTGVTYTFSNGKVALSGTPTGGNNFYINSVQDKFSVVQGHKYIALGSDRARNIMLQVTGIGTMWGDTVYTAISDRSEQMLLFFSASSDTDGYECYPQLFDLTLMFGAGNEPETVEEFEAMFPLPYYPYSAPKLLPVDMRGIETVGFNAYNPSTGTADLLGGNEYQISGTYTQLSYSTGESIVPDSDGIFTPSENGTLTVTGGNATDTCVHLVWSGYRNGEYEEHWSAERPVDTSRFFPTGLKKVGDKADALYADHYDTVVGEVDLGALTWTESGVYYSTSYLLPNVKVPASGGVVANAQCDTYEIQTSNAVSGGTATGLGIRPNGSLYVSNTGHTPTGILYYELATPTTTEIDPPLNLSYKVSDFGTERIMVDETADAPQTAPVPMEVEYGLNAIDTIRRLPKEYQSHKSIGQLTTALESSLGIDITETWDEDDQRYEYEVSDFEIADGAVTPQSLSDDVTHGQYPSLSVGRADALTGADSTAQWATRESTGSGAATVRSVQGATVVWNQLVGADTSTVTIPSGNKYLSVIGGTSAIATSDGTAISVTGGTDQVFDLTKMFGSGNEPTTVAEFERMFPESYYPYSAPTLKPVTIAGVKTLGTNLLNLERTEIITDAPYLNTTPRELNENQIWFGIAASNYFNKNALDDLDVDTYSVTFNTILANSKWYGVGFPVRVVGGTTYKIDFGQYTGEITVAEYGADGSFIKQDYGLMTSGYTASADARWAMVIFVAGESDSTSPSFFKPIIHTGTGATAYKPYMSDAIEWTTQTLRAAGSVADMLYSDHVETRVGVVDLGTLEWRAYTTNGGKNIFLATFATSANYTGAQTVPNARCADYETVSLGAVGNLTTDKVFSLGSYYTSGPNVYVSDSTYTTAAEFKAAMNGVLLFYELATPTTTPISPALPMTYRVEQGGTESIVVPEGEISAAPVLTIAEGESAAELVMDALACIATPDGPVATSNHALNTYLTMGGKLYKVTSAIAVGETITPNTNVTETTVMAELIARTA